MLHHISGGLADQKQFACHFGLHLIMKLSAGSHKLSIKLLKHSYAAP